MDPPQPPSSDPPSDRIEDTTGGTELVRIHNATGSDEPSTGAMDIVRREDEHGYVLGEVGEEGIIHSANHPDDDDDDDGYLIGSHTDLQLSSTEKTKKAKHHRVPQDDSLQHEIDQKRLGIVI